MDKKYNITDMRLLVFEFDQEEVILEDKNDNVCIYQDKKINVVIFDCSERIPPGLGGTSNVFFFIKNGKKMYIDISGIMTNYIYYKNFPFMEGCFELDPKLDTKNLVTDKCFYQELIFIKGSDIKVSEKMQETVFEGYNVLIKL